MATSEGMQAALSQGVLTGDTRLEVTPYSIDLALTTSEGIRAVHHSV